MNFLYWTLGCFCLLGYACADEEVPAASPEEAQEVEMPEAGMTRHVRSLIPNFPMSYI